VADEGFAKMKYIMVFCLFIVSLSINVYGEIKMRAHTGRDVLDDIAAWIWGFEDIQQRMPESIDELLEKMPQHRGAFELDKERGYIVNYTRIDTHSMIVKVQDGEDIYECYNKLKTYYYYRNGAFIREFTVDPMDKYLPVPMPPGLLQDLFLTIPMDEYTVFDLSKGISVELTTKFSNIKKNYHTLNFAGDRRYRNINYKLYEADGITFVISPTFFSEDDDNVLQIKIQSSNYVTKRGITIGSSKDQVVSKYGNADFIRNNSFFYYNQEFVYVSLMFQFDEKGLVTSIELSAGTHPGERATYE